MRFRRAASVLLAGLVFALPLARPDSACALPVPALDHVVVVIMENKSYDQVRTQPYTAQLIALGASFAASSAVTHPSQPNYFTLWAGSTLGVTNDNCPPAGTPFSAENLGHACEVAGKTWRAYSENLPSAGATGCSYDGSASTGLYTRKHDVWVSFANVTHSNERPYSDLAVDIAANNLPNLAFIIPNNCHNTHNSTTPGCSIADGDAWLASNLPPILNALGTNGVLILTWDEDNGAAGNHILTVFAGARVIPGAVSNRSIFHYTVVRTIADALGITAPALAAVQAPIDDVWQVPTATRPSSWGRVKTIYR